MKKRYKKMYMSDLLKELEIDHGKKFVEEFRETSYNFKISKTLFEGSKFYVVKHYESKGNVWLRLTYPFYILTAILFWLVARPIYWLSEGRPLYLETVPWFGRFIKKWDDKGGFGIW